MDEAYRKQTVVTSPTVEFLLKQVYIAYREKVKGLESEVKLLKSKLNDHKTRQDNCEQCKILSEEVRKCKENYLESLSDQKHRIELLEMQLSTMQRVPVARSKMTFPSKAKEHLLEKTIDGEISKRRKMSEELQFLNPTKVKKEECFSLDKSVNLEKENSKLLPNIIVPETLETDINVDAEVTFIGPWGKKEKEIKHTEITTVSVVPESIDIDMRETIKPEIRETTAKSKGKVDIVEKHHHKISRDFDNHDIDSPSLLSHTAMLVGRPERNKHDNEQDISRMAQQQDKKSKSDTAACDANTTVRKDVTSPSLISPPEKNIQINNVNSIQCNHHTTKNVSSSSISSFGNRASFCRSRDMLEDMDETYFPFPHTSHDILQQDKKNEHDYEQDISRMVQHQDKKAKSDTAIVYSACDENTTVRKTVTSPSLISPTESNIKVNAINNIQCNHTTKNVSSCSISRFGDRTSLCKSQDMLEDMDETCFPLPLASQNTLQLNKNTKLDCGQNDNRDIAVLDNAPSEVHIIEEKLISDDKHPSTGTEQFNLPIDVTNNPADECSFDRIPRKDTGVIYKFKEDPVRKKEERSKLLGHPCKQCEEYYNRLDLPGSEKARRISMCSRHRAVYHPPSTPEHYWELEFPDTPECKARGYVNETQKIQLQSRRRRPLTLRKDK